MPAPVLMCLGTHYQSSRPSGTGPSILLVRYWARRVATRPSTRLRMPYTSLRRISSSKKSSSLVVGCVSRVSDRLPSTL